jgi:4-diphosphocytidyl-2-C-methyl-D-erythritol kinase
VSVPGRIEPLPPIAFVPAFAKINLTLDVLGKREDGYHRLASVMRTIALHDTLALRPASGEEITCVCDLPELETADNLAVRAAHLARSTRDGGDENAGLMIELLKEVPMQAGLGGGSSDGATVLVTLNRLWRLGHSRRRLEELSAQLGSDLPFFVTGGTALIEGRGEVVQPLPDTEPLWLVLAKPPIPVPTGRVFQQLSPRDYTDAANTRAVVSAIRRGEPLPLTSLANALERGVLAEYPAVAAVWDALVAAGAPVVRMSGSGPTLFAPFRDLRAAAQVYHRMREVGTLCWLTRTVTRDEVRRSREIAWVDVRPLSDRH